MLNHSEIKEIIQQSYKQLPSNQRKIAEYFLENLNDIPFLSIHELSRKSSSSVASLVRFSKRIGFAGYAEVREKIAETLQTRINNKEFFTLVDQKNLKNDTLKSVAEIDIKNINETLASINREGFSESISEILRARRVYTAGLGISFLLAEILAYQLTQVAVKASNFRRNSLLFIEQGHFLDSKDLLIVFSFPPYSQETIDLVKFCYEKKVKIIAITNKTSAPAVFYADYSLIVKSKNMLYTNSFAAISVVINAIATEVAVRNKLEVQRFYEKTGGAT